MYNIQLLEDGHEVPVILTPDGNVKYLDKTCCQCTQKSTVSKIKDTTWKPKSLIFHLCTENSGIIGSHNCSTLSHNRRQLYNSKHLSTSNNSSNCSERTNRILDFNQQCKVDLTLQGVVRSVSFEINPSCMLATDDQLQNLVSQIPY